MYSLRFLYNLGLVNLFGGSVMGYNIGVVSGLTKPLIRCTLFKETDNIPLDVYIVMGVFVSPYY